MRFMQARMFSRKGAAPVAGLALLFSLACSDARGTGAVYEPLGQRGAHEHGVAALDMAVDGALATVFLRVPAGDLFGFEHQPRTEQERQQRALALDRLESNLVVMLGLDGLGCVVSASSVAGVGAEVDADHAAQHTDHAHDAHQHDAHQHDAHQHDDAAHGADDGTDEHGDHEGAEFEAEFTLACDAPLGGTELALDFRSAFPAIEKLDLQVLSERTTFGQRVPASGTRIAL